MNQSVEDAVWRLRRREKSPMTDITALQRAIEAEAKRRGWIVQTDVKDNGDFTIRLIDARGDSTEIKPPDLGVHTQTEKCFHE